MREQNGVERLVKVDIGGGRFAFIDPVTVMRILDEPGGRTAICGAGWSVLCTLAASEVYAALSAAPSDRRAPRAPALRESERLLEERQRDANLAAEGRPEAANRLTPSPRFGYRLREALDRRPPGTGVDYFASLLDVADAIDADAEAALSEVHEAWSEENADLRSKVEAVVERLRFPVQGSTGETPTRDLIEVEDLLLALNQILGGER